MTKIEWTETTWNPIVGCSVTSPGCTNCYAMHLAGTRLAHLPKYDGLTQDSKTKRSSSGAIAQKGTPVWTGKLAFDEKALLEPLRWKKPRMVFVNSMGDLFHEDCPDGWIDRVFAVMALCPQHTFQVLTKRAGRMRDYFAGPVAQDGKNVRRALWRQALPDSHALRTVLVPWPLPNVWLGVSVEDQQRADERIPDLLATPAALRWISAEPLLGPVDLTTPFYKHSTGYEMQGYLRDKAEHDDFRYFAEKLDWVVAGGESGKGARPMHPDWARSLRDQCAAAGVPFFFKQWGDHLPFGQWVAGSTPTNFAEMTKWCNEPGFAARVGKKRAGRFLDGQIHDAMPRRDHA